MAQLFKNNATTRLATSLGTGGGITFDVTTGDGDNFPATSTGEFFLVTVENSAGSKEIIKVTRAGDTFTIPATGGRGLDGTSEIGFVAGDLVELRLTAGFIQSLARGSFVFVVDGGGATITEGIKGFIEAPFTGVISSAKVFADVSGSISISIYKSTFENYPFSDPADIAEEITNSAGGEELVISSAYKTNPIYPKAGWMLEFNRGDVFIFKVNTCTDITKATISISVNRTIEAE